MSSMKTGSGGMSVGPRDARLANSERGVAADQRLRDLGKKSEGRVFGRSPIDRPVVGGGAAPTRANDTQGETDNLRSAASPTALTR